MPSLRPARPAHAVRSLSPCTGRGWDPRETREGPRTPGPGEGPPDPRGTRGARGAREGDLGPLGPGTPKIPQKGVFSPKTAKIGLFGLSPGKPRFPAFFRLRGVLREGLM